MLPKTAAAILLCAILSAQPPRVDPRNTYNRIVTVVPMIGKGTSADPRRPQYAPWPPNPAGTRTGIIAFNHQVSDDGKSALVEFIARDRSAFATILADKSLKVFEKGKDKKDDIEKEFKKYKKDFDLAKFGMVHP